MKEKTTKKPEVTGPQLLLDRPATEMNGRTCLGALFAAREPKCRILFVRHLPTFQETRMGRPQSDSSASFLMETLSSAGFDPAQGYFTYAIKYATKKPSATDEKWCRGMFLAELEHIRPDVVVPLGAEALRFVTGNATDYQISACRGAFVTCRDREGNVRFPFQVYPTFQLDQVRLNERYQAMFARDLLRLANRLNGTEKPLPKVENISIKTVEELRNLGRDLRECAEQNGGRLLLALDCEWGGRNWMDPDRYFRTIQLGLDDAETVFTLEVARENGVLIEPRQKELFAALKEILEAPWVDLVGHNVIADGEWLLSYGIDIRERVVYDTMLAEYMIDNAGPFGLEELTMKYTDIGRYSWEVEVWCKRHRKTVEGPESYGYAQVPHEMLLGYAAYDVAVLHLIMEKQMPILEDRGYFKPRGLHGEHPSMFDTTMAMQKVLYELERNGLPTDHDQLDMLTEKYQGVRSKLLSEVMQMARAAGMPDFNPRSSDDLRKLLFGVLKLPPVKTTDGDSWADTVGNMGMDDEDADDVKAATDKTTLEILDGEHPLVHKLLQFKRIDQSCKTWLRKTDEKGAPAGLYKLLWPDGRLRSRFSQLTATGRLRSASPNCFPGEVEVLTERGWMHWDTLYSHPERNTIKLAQWDVSTREITFSVPNFYVKKENQECIRFRTQQQIDIVCTPDHRFTVLSRKDLSSRKTVEASCLKKCSDYFLPQAGHVAKTGTSLNVDQVSVICALQADGSLVKFGGIDWSFSKKRKVERLVGALERLGIRHRVGLSNDGSSRVKTRICIGKNDIPDWLAGRKFFGPWLLEYDSETLKLFSEEVWLWDGCTNRRSMYASAGKTNSDFVQALCTLTGRRARIRRYVSNTNSVSWQVDAATGWYSQLANSSEEPYGKHDVYCVNMPKDTVIVRFNNRVAFAHQCQNWPKQAESFMTDIFGKGNEPPVIRTIVKPEKGWCMIEGDFCQAELFTLANLSQDPGMLRALTTPGLDLHDKTAIDAFGLVMEDENGKEVTEDDLIRLANEMGGSDTEEYEYFMKMLTYIDKHGKRMSRAEFKSSIRVASKSINFGIA